ncbi:MAG: lysoplasmalogenase [Micrococcales bacterium]|nr:lysoplasmalogenase [Micrococcales bacterium]
MTTTVWVLSVALAVTALLNWGSVARGDRVIERITTPSFIVLLIGLAWSLHGEGRAPGAPTLTPIIIALGLSLVGDVALLHATRARFLLGLTAFLLAHIAWIGAILELPRAEGLPWWLLPTVPVLVLLHARFGRDIVRRAGSQRLPVFAYQVVLMALVLVAAWRGDLLVLLGCFAFLVSDTILGHDRFVLERRFAPLLVMVTYHAAQVLIVVGLLR